MVEELAARALGSGMFWFGLFLGVLTGIAFQKARSARAAYRATKGLLPGMRRTMWATGRRFVGFAVVVAVLVIASIGWIAGNSTEGDPVPASVPTPSASPR